MGLSKISNSSYKLGGQFHHQRVPFSSLGLQAAAEEEEVGKDVMFFLLDRYIMVYR